MLGPRRSKLCDGLTSRRLTLLSAPAGYGKTTLLAAYCAEVQRSGGANRLPCSPAQVAWLTLDEGDNAPALFLLYLVAALQRLNPACGATVQTLLAGAPIPPMLALSKVEGSGGARGAGAEARRIVGVLINDVLETLPDPFALILDDLHLISEPTVFTALDYLLERLPPQMHLVVGTRHDPPLALARLRARGQVAELSLADLRFTDDESALFLNEKLRLGLSPDDLATLQDRTEGWPVGLRLLASSLDCIPAPAGRTAFITDLAQTDRYVFDFLAEEVLNRQEPAVRTFLLETSILFELTPNRCQAVTGRMDAPSILEDLYRRSLFLVAVDAAGTTFRFHALFAKFLRQRLAQEMPGRVCDLHRRAAETQADPSRAISHYLAAEMWEEAVQAIAQVSVQLFQRGMIDTLAGWVRALPPLPPPHLVQQQMVRAWLGLLRGDWARAEADFEAALAVTDLGVDAAMFVAVAHAARGDYAAADRFFEVMRRPVEEVPLLRKVLKVASLYLQGPALWSRGCWEEARQVYAQMCAARSPDALPSAPVLRLMMRGLLESSDGQYAQAERSLREAASLERQVRLSTLYGSARLLLAHLYLKTNSFHISIRCRAVCAR